MVGVDRPGTGGGALDSSGGKPTSPENEGLLLPEDVCEWHSYSLVQSSGAP